MSRIVLILASAVLFAGAVAGCGGGEDKVLTKVFVAPPWATDETNEYNLVIEDGSVYGTCVLETRLKSDGTNTRLNKLCGDGENRGVPRFSRGRTELSPSIMIALIESFMPTRWNRPR